MLDVYQNNVVKNRINGNGNSWFTGGNVGIGTEAPEVPLQVVGGGMRCKVKT